MQGSRSSQGPSSACSPSQEPDVPAHDRQPRKCPKRPQADACLECSPRRSRFPEARTRAPDALDFEPLVGEEEPEALACEGATMRVVVPNPSLRVGRRSKDASAGTQHSSHLNYDCDGIANVLKQILDDDPIELRILERKPPVHIALDDIPSTLAGSPYRLRRYVDPGVVREVISQPPAAKPRSRRTVSFGKWRVTSREVARLRMPVEIAHAHWSLVGAYHPLRGQAGARRRA